MGIVFGQIKKFAYGLKRLLVATGVAQLCKQLRRSAKGTGTQQLKYLSGFYVSFLHNEIQVVCKPLQKKIVGAGIFSGKHWAVLLHAPLRLLSPNSCYISKFTPGRPSKDHFDRRKPDLHRQIAEAELYETCSVWDREGEPSQFLLDLSRSFPLAGLTRCLAKSKR